MKRTIWDDVLHSTIRIEASFPNGVNGTGTGFFYRYNVHGREIPVIITNNHVVDGAMKLNFKFTIEDEHGNPVLTNHFNWEVKSVKVFVIRHPKDDVDLCIIPFAHALQEAETQGLKLFYRVIDKSDIPNQQQLIENIATIEEITMVGYPNGLWDSINNLPILRRGITATPPHVNYAGKEEFVIDAACFPGSSGSPIFLIDNGSFTDRNGNVTVGQTRVFLLGILYAGPQIVTTGEVRVVDIPTVNRPIAETRMMMNLGYVIKSNKLNDFEPIVFSMVNNERDA
ncbi:serine protease [Planococcus sp. SIMBA_143]